MVNVSSPGTSGKVPQMKVTGMPGKHVPTSFVEAVNDLVQAVRIFRKVVPEIFASLQLTRERRRQRMGGCWSWATAILKMEAVVGLSVAIGMSSCYGLFRPSFYRSQPVEQDLHHSRYSHGRRSESRPEHYKGQNIDLMLIRHLYHFQWSPWTRSRASSLSS